MGPALSDLSLLLSRGGCEPSDYMDMLPLPSAVKEAPVLQEEYIPLFFVKIYKTARVSKQFDPLFCFFVKLHF